MENPNNCETCDHIHRPDGGHCYMFRDPPTEVCYQHTKRRLRSISLPALIERVLANADLNVTTQPEPVNDDV